MTYSYETFPGQTIVRTCVEGYSKKQLVAELKNNMDGIVTIDESRTDKFCKSIEGKAFFEKKK